MVGVVLLAMVAGFLALRLYAVLGKRTGHEQPFVAPADPAPRPVAPLVEEASKPAMTVSDSPVDYRPAAGDHGQHLRRPLLTPTPLTPRRAIYDEVRAAFAEAIAVRASDGHTLDNRLVTIERAIISDASLDGRIANVTVRFDADIAAVTRDADGRVIAGSTDDAVPTHDAWTFSRTVKSSDPNWILTDTDESA